MLRFRSGTQFLTISFLHYLKLLQNLLTFLKFNKLHTSAWTCRWKKVCGTILPGRSGRVSTEQDKKQWKVSTAELVWSVSVSTACVRTVRMTAQQKHGMFGFGSQEEELLEVWLYEEIAGDPYLFFPWMLSNAFWIVVRTSLKML